MDSMYQEPPSGSMTSPAPLSKAMTCCVRRAIWTAFSVGRERASSIEFVCSDCVPPRTAARAWRVVRTMLFSGCWAVRVAPPVCVWKRSIIERGFFASKRSFMMVAQMRRAARNLATSSSRLLWQAKKKLRRPAKASTSRPAATAAST